MRVLHLARYSPYQAGMYETVRDMIAAERRSGIEAELFDVGEIGKGGQVGAVDDRPGCCLRTLSVQEANGSFDLLAAHTDLPWSLFSPATPVVHVIHGRPESSFRLSQRDEKAPVYQLLDRWSRDLRFRGFLTLWREHLPYWRALLPEARLSALSAPPCDLDLFAAGPRHSFSPSGAPNILVADMWRPDGDPYHVIHELIEAAPQGSRVHMYGARNPLGPWQYVLRALDQRGIRGEVKGMMRDFDRILRGADVIVTGHSIATRIMREALAVGRVVVAPFPCRHVPRGWQYTVGQGDMRAAITSALGATWGDPGVAHELARPFALGPLGREIVAFYEEALRG